MGLLAYSGLCLGMQGRINIQGFGDYLIHALESEDEECCRVGCAIVSDIASALEGDIKNYLSSFMPKLLETLKSQKRSH